MPELRRQVGGTSSQVIMRMIMIMIYDIDDNDNDETMIQKKQLRCSVNYIKPFVH